MAAVTLVLPSRTDASTYVLYALTVDGGSDWKNVDGARYAPNPNCDNALAYAFNSVRTSAHFLNATSWLDGGDGVHIWPPDPDFETIDHVYLNVNGRYDDQSSNNRFIVRLQGTVINPAWDNAAWAWAQSGDASCAWRYGGGEGWDITSLRPQGWSAADIQGLSPGFRRNDNGDVIGGSSARINAIRLIIVTKPARPVPPTLTLAGVFYGEVDMTVDAPGATSGVRLERSLDGGQSFLPVGTFNPTRLLRGFSWPGARVLYRACSIGNVGESDFSNVVDVTTIDCMSSPTAGLSAYPHRAPEVSGPQPWCGTEVASRNIARSNVGKRMTATNVPYCGVGECDAPEVRDATVRAPFVIRVVIHLMRHPDGSGYATYGMADTLIAQLNRDLNPYAIGVRAVATIAHNDERYAVMPASGDIAWLNDMKTSYAVNPTSNLNIFVSEGEGPLEGIGTFPWDPNAKGALGGLWLKASGNIFTYGTPTHEMGHCLGLWHTFHGVEMDEGVDGPLDPCYELTGRGDMNSVGDLCEDTRPTPKHYECTEPLLCDALGRAWTPTPLRNHMGYSFGCQDEFTWQQAQRMHCWTRSELGLMLEDVVAEAGPEHGRDAGALQLAVTGIPAGGGARAWLSLPASGIVVTSILDLAGRTIDTGRKGYVLAGRHEARWNGRDSGGRAVPAGIYIYRVEWRGRSIARKFAITR